MTRATANLAMADGSQYAVTGTEITLHGERFIAHRTPWDRAPAHRQAWQVSHVDSGLRLVGGCDTMRDAMARARNIEAREGPEAFAKAMEAGIASVRRRLAQLAGASS
jgi:hypothetical protein